jgi:aminopeptidase
MELSKREMRWIARSFVRRCMRVGKKRERYEAVRLLYNYTDPTCEKFARAVEEECWKLGAHTLTLRYSSARERLWYLLKPKNSLREISPFAEAIARKADVSIFIGEEDDPNWAANLSSKLRLTAPIRQRLRDILDRRRVRWAYFGWPIPGATKVYGCKPKDFRRIFFASIRETFKPRLGRLCRTYARFLQGKRVVRIVANDGTDLSFRVTGRPILVDDGVISDDDVQRGDVGLNIPAGEVFLAPLEHSAEGRIVFENVAIPGFGRVRGLELVFKQGRIAHYKAERGAGNFGRFLRANTGEKDRIAEFGIGTNPGAEYTGGSIIIDEKIFGTVHIAIGNNRGAYHGKNKASSHLDLIKEMGSGEVFADDELMMSQGKPVQLPR